jgi:hypothetical protein
MSSNRLEDCIDVKLRDWQRVTQQVNRIWTLRIDLEEDYWSERSGIRRGRDPAEADEVYHGGEL